MKMRISGLLDGKDEIAKFLGGATDYKLRKYVAAGMPVLIDGGRWLAHADNLEQFFKYYTRKRANPNALDDWTGAV